MTRCRPPAPLPPGFTLIELLVAITILSIVALIAWRGLDSLIATRARLVPENEEARALLITFGQMERDLAQVAVPTLFALNAAPVAVRASSAGPVLQILRIAPPDDTGATAVQTVFYRVADGLLLRQVTPAARTYGPVPPEQLSQARLLPQVQSIRIRLWRDNRWIETLGDAAAPAPPVSGVPGLAAQPPAGIEVTIERTDGRTFRRVLLVG